MTITFPEQSQFKALNEKDLILNLKSETDSRVIKALQFEFYNRYAPYVFKIATQACRSYEDADFLAREVLQKTFINAFKALGNFDLPDPISDDVCKKVLKAWLGKIGNTELKKVYAEKKDVYNLSFDDTYEPVDSTFISSLEEEVVEIPNEFMLKLNKALDSLKEIDRLIVLTYASEGCINSKKHLSKNSMDFLIKTFETTPENIRQRKRRALEKIKTICFSS